MAGVEPTPTGTPPPAPAAPKNETLDKIEAVPLSPHAQPKTAEAFATVKTLAKEEIGRLSTELTALRAQVEELKARPAADPQAEADKKELEELRQFRAGIQLRGDPAFAERFDKPLATLEEQFLAKLKSVGASDKNIADIKAQGGLDGVDVELLVKTAAEADPTSRRVLEAILRKRDDLKVERDGVIGQSEEKLKQEVERFRKEQATAGERVTKEIGSGFDGLLPRVPALQKYEIPAGADEKTKANLQAANQQLEATIRDARALSLRSDPAARAELGVLAALGVVHRLKAQGLRQALTTTRAELDKVKAEHAGEIKKLNEQLATLRGASRIGSGRDPLKTTEVPKPADLPLGATASAAFDAYEKARQANQD